MSKYELMLLSVSLSATLLALFVFLIRKIYKNRLSHTLRYYIWLPVLFRALIPFSFDVAVINILCQKYYTYTHYFVKPMVFGEPGNQIIIGSNVHAPALQDLNPFTIWMTIWLVGAVGLLIHKVTSYYGFSKYIKSGWQPVDAPELLDVLGDLCEKQNIQQSIDLYINPLLSTPLVLGIFKPVIVLPSIPQDAKLLYYTLNHELVHCKRQDVIYIWLMQLALCVHWFNPLFYLIHKHTARDRELSCDEQVIKPLCAQERITYGRTLLETLQQSGTYKERHVTAALLENKSLLRERLEFIGTETACPLSRSWIVATLCILLFFALALGTYTP